MDSDNYNLIQTKTALRKLFLEALHFNIPQEMDDEIMYFNKDLFDLENCLSQLKEQYSVNLKLDARYYSDKIMQSFDDKPKAYTRHDYSLPFLIHLCHQREHDAENLIALIESFIRSVLHKFTYQDIVITKTGTTRCYTNIRFGLGTLRKYGLIYNEGEVDSQMRRVILPTPVGYIIALYHLKEGNTIAHQFLPDKTSGLGFSKTLYNTIIALKADPQGFLNLLWSKYKLEGKLANTIKQVIKDYDDILMRYIELKGDKLVVHEVELDKAMKAYYGILSSQCDLAYRLKQLFLESITPEVSGTTI